ncbi:MAG: tetratricopeptide repeat protein [Chlorobiales bacterium]|jgi:tetratricopeptide (TPR) repeat protein|nr:tetratricopeptide repeat protein [Chlorobiales bacterium]
MENKDLSGFKNVNTGSIDAKGNVSIGDKIITNIYCSAAYQDLKKQEQELNDNCDEAEQTVKDYPGDDRFKLRLSEIAQKRSEVKKKIEALKQEVLKLAEDFTRIPLNTERLRLAKQYFEDGDYDKARAVLNAETMGVELEAMLSQKEQLTAKQVENDANLIDKANEYLILARLTAIDFSLPNRFEKTMECFETSLKASRNEKNLFAYAHFLQKHNQFITAQPLYEEILEIYRKLAVANPEAYLPDVAMTLNNLGALQAKKNKFEGAENAYREALEISRKRSDANLKADLPDAAMMLSNLVPLQSAKNGLEEAESSYREALEIYRTLSEENPEVYMPDVARTAVNMSVFYLQYKPDKKLSLASAADALWASAPFLEMLPAVKEYAEKALRVVQAWGEDVDTFLDRMGNEDDE